MSNKRDLKKAIVRLSDDLACAVAVTAQVYGHPTQNEYNLLMWRILQMQYTAMANMYFSFDKARKDFDNDGEYNRARQAYEKAAFRKLKETFNTTYAEIVKDFNSQIPADVKEQLSKEAF